MFEFFKEQILAGEYDLLKMLERITAVYATGKLTTEEFAQLRTLAQEHANPIDSLAPLEDRFGIVLTKMSELMAAVDALGARVTALEAGDDTEPGDDPETPEEPSTSYPEWVQPLGADVPGFEPYKTGDRVMYQGKVYESTIDGNVWAPDVYPAGWKEITETETETETTEEE